MRITVPLLLFVSSAAAQAELAFDASVIDQCLASGLAETCIGVAAAACEREDGAMARGLCLGHETAYWQARADDARAVLAAGEPAILARATHRGTPVADLARIDAAFLAYRAVTCDWRQAQWDGVHSGFEWADCRMRLTAQHALRLEGWLDD